MTLSISVPGELFQRRLDRSQGESDQLLTEAQITSNITTKTKGNSMKKEII